MGNNNKHLIDEYTTGLFHLRGHMVYVWSTVQRE